MIHPKTYVGNAKTDGKANRGWFVGHFIKPIESPRSNSDVEIKWFEHKKGEKREGWSMNEAATTMGLVVRGKFKIIFEDCDYILEEGDYYITLPKVPHKFSVEKNSIVITVRWPSLPFDHKDVSHPPLQGLRGVSS